MKIHEKITEQKEFVQILEDHYSTNALLIVELSKEENNTKESAQVPEWLPISLHQILKYQNIDLRIKTEKQKEKLRELIHYEQTIFPIEFEKQSREANLNLIYYLQQAEKLNNNPNIQPAFKKQLIEKIAQWEKEGENYEQETKNEFYNELKILIQFIKKQK